MNYVLSSIVWLYTLLGRFVNHNREMKAFKPALPLAVPNRLRAGFL